MKLSAENPQCADLVDWSKSAYLVGVKVQGKETIWEGASVEDLKLLKALLTRRLKLMTQDGVMDCPPVVEGSEFFRKLSQWAGAALEWSERQKERRNP